MKLLQLSLMSLILFSSCSSKNNDGIGRFQAIEGTLRVNTSKTDPLPPAQCDPPKKTFNSWVN
jgi:hypothetical protein